MAIGKRTRGKWTRGWSGWGARVRRVAATNDTTLQLEALTADEADVGLPLGGGRFAAQVAAGAVLLSTSLAWSIQQVGADLPVVVGVPDELYWIDGAPPVAPATYLRLPLGDPESLPQLTVPAPIVNEDYWYVPAARPWPAWIKQPPIDPDVVSSATPGVGPAGAASFVLDLEPGARITYSWLTDVQKSWIGLEHRTSLIGAPRQRYEATAYIVDGDERTIRTALIANAAQQLPFLLGLPHEALSLSADSVGTTVNVWSTALCDWAQPGQRVIVQGPDKAIVAGVVQTSAPSSIVLDVAPGAAGKNGGLIMPAQAIYLEPSQALARHQVTVSHWALVARAALFGFAGVDAMGVGATLTTYSGLVVYNYRNDIDETAANAILTLGEVLDSGALPIALGGADVVDETREVRIESNHPLDWQWFKLFLFTILGRFSAFLLPTWQPDLVFHGNPGGSQLLVKSGSVAGAGNYVTVWTNSLAHRRLQVLRADATVQYVTVSAVFDNGDGTITLTLDATVTGSVAMLSFLETCRLESDDVEVTWNSDEGQGWTFESSNLARVVQ